ncbi:DNA phosphorothioation system sulfurtransferase DndC [archaeon]|jgi:DNA sulfur modification protein DndC|nr:DNA phosphorothioation system sulfurtransferase DndC [archaeon]MBT4648403.1 DNA phosphorothioation system sulfurtransferase DndC [archaeon]
MKLKIKSGEKSVTSIKNNSVFEKKSLDSIYNEIQKVYLSDSKPWIIGYSGGKDSTTILQLIWYALAKLPKKNLHKKVHVISSNTLVESPFLIKMATESIKKINVASRIQKLPLSAEHVMPEINNSFWVNILGRGYPAPTKTFRWCTDRLKIQPADKYIIDKVAYHGDVIVVLGVRKDESATRAQAMNLYKIKNSLLSRHSKYPQAFVYAPISDFSTDDVWSYLLQKKNPWGMNNRDLLAMYKNPDDTECPLVVDKTTTSCGNSRFGCWTCTVVKKDKSLQNLIDQGNDWMIPLLELRDFLYKTTLPETKHEYRDFRGRNGHVRMKSNGTGISRGPYKLSFLKILLEKILQAQKKINKMAPEEKFKLILPKELYLIREMWVREKGDWSDSLPKIYSEIMGTDLDWIDNDWGLFSFEEKTILDKICLNENISTELIVSLLDAERNIQGMTKRSTALNKIDKILRKEWRSEKEVLKTMVQGDLNDHK